MRQRVENIFKAANHKDPKANMEQLEKLLPVGEKHWQSGMPNRFAWAAASK